MRRVWVRVPDDKHREALRVMMSARGFTVRGLAERVGCSKSMIQALRKEPGKSCTRDLAEAIAEALDVPHDTFFVTSVSTKTGGRSPKRRTAA